MTKRKASLTGLPIQTFVAMSWFLGLLAFGLTARPALGQFTEDQKLTASDAEPGDYFGFSVSISGDTMVVGAFLDDCVAGLNCGSAYVYQFNGVAWFQQAKLTATDAASGVAFGH